MRVGLGDVVLALLQGGPRHGYEIKRDHDEWYADAKPLAFGQVYATLGRLERGGLVEVAETRTEHGPERTVYALTTDGRKRLEEWLCEPAPVADGAVGEIVRKTVAALRTGADPMPFLAAQRAAHLRRMRELSDRAAAAEPVARLVADHVIAHLDADLRWLDAALQRATALSGGSRKRRS